MTNKKTSTNKRKGPRRNKKAAGSVHYRVYPRGIYVEKTGPNGRTVAPLTNFAAKIITDIQKDDGVEATRIFELEASLNGRRERFLLTADEFSAMNWTTEKLGATAVVFPHRKEDARAAIQQNSANVESRHFYAHVGWRKINGSWRYLHTEGGIGAEGNDPLIKVELPSKLSPVILPTTADPQSIIEAVRASIAIVDLGSERVTLPVLALAYRAPLGDCNFSLQIIGKTGIFKTQLAALIQQHWGAAFNAENLPSGWSSTVNANEALAFIAKDMVLVIDDFAPVGSRPNRQRMNSDADRYFRSQANGSGRARMNADGTLQDPKPPRCLTLSTGEDMPLGQSLSARALIIPMSEGDIDRNKLTLSQKAGASGLFAVAMAAFIKWLAPRLDEVRTQLSTEIIEGRENFSAPHRRISTTAVNLLFGFTCFLRFAQEIGAITAEQASQLVARAKDAVVAMVGAQESTQKENDPACKYIQLITSALGSGAAYLAGIDGSEPVMPEAHGYRVRSVGTGDYEREEWQPQGDKIGWRVGEDIYLNPKAAYNVAQKVAKDEPLEVSESSLRKRLFEAHLLKTTQKSKGRDTYTNRRLLESVRHEVLHFDREVFGLPECEGAMTLSGWAETMAEARKKAKSGNDTPTYTTS